MRKQENNTFQNTYKGYEPVNYADTISDQDLEKIKTAERIEACCAIVKEFQDEELTFEFKSNEDGAGTFYIMNYNPIRITVLDFGHVVFSWFSDSLTNIIGSKYLEESTTLKSRISYQKNHGENGLTLCVEYSLICVNEDLAEFARSVALNVLFFQADINTIVDLHNTDETTVATRICWGD